MGNQKYILIVEDEKIYREFYSKTIKQNGYRVNAACDGEEGLLMTRAEKPDLIVLDLMLPKKSGFEMLREIKQDEDLKDIPVIVLTNLAQEVDRKTCESIGVIGYLVKTENTMKQIIERLDSHFGGSKAR
ncbi:response regulator [Candidatus Uhrbacteria bacterium]|jgi:CheY-like chemotaxis protein|nr:response regulator [Candidatus Uhrbacteria bacterium]